MFTQLTDSAEQLIAVASHHIHHHAAALVHHFACDEMSSDLMQSCARWSFAMEVIRLFLRCIVCPFICVHFVHIVS
jgi:hypothetical protein